jgi:hypothetical protein
MATKNFTLGIKQLGHKANHSPPLSIKAKTVYSHTSTLPYALLEWCSIKEKDNHYLDLFLLIFYKLQKSRRISVPIENKRYF